MVFGNLRSTLSAYGDKKSEELVLRIKFTDFEKKEFESFWELISKECIFDFENQFFMSYSDEIKSYRKFAQMEKKLLSKKEFAAIVQMVYNNSQLEQINSMSAAEKYVEALMEDFDGFDLVCRNRVPLRQKRMFSDDKSYLQYIMSLRENYEGMDYGTSVLFPDMELTVDKICGDNGKFCGTVAFAVKGFLMDYKYDDVISNMKSLIVSIGNRFENVIANILLKKQFGGMGGYSDLIQNPVFDEYGKYISEILALDEIGIVNYLPESILTKTYMDTIGTDGIEVQNAEKGIFFSINKSIKDITYSDIRNLRRQYLDDYLLKVKSEITSLFNDISLDDIDKMYLMYDEEISLETMDYGTCQDLVLMFSPKMD